RRGASDAERASSHEPRPRRTPGRGRGVPRLRLPLSRGGRGPGPRPPGRRSHATGEPARLPRRAGGRAVRPPRRGDGLPRRALLGRVVHGRAAARRLGSALPSHVAHRRRVGGALGHHHPRCPGRDRPGARRGALELRARPPVPSRTAALEPPADRGGGARGTDLPRRPARPRPPRTRRRRRSRRRAAARGPRHGRRPPPRPGRGHRLPSRSPRTAGL
ncbi:MAG: hypothetical protein AVDCRST_MAG79-2192, partial [uncultured Thermoleophilia bacterium]